MEIITALEAKNKFGLLIDKAQQAPVQINKHGRAVAYMISSHEYEKLNKLREASLKEAIFKANMEEAKETEYQKELKLWEKTLYDGL